MKARQSRFLPSGLLLLLAVALLGVASFPEGQPAAAAPPAGQLPTELQYVPHDAAFFLYADAAGIWKSALAKTFREADKNSFNNLEDMATRAFGAKIDDLKSVTLFFPQFKMPPDAQKFGVVVRFSKAYDQKKLEAGLAGLLPKNAKIKLVAPSETIALLLVGLDDSYGKPQLANSQGPLTPAIQAAATGKHTLVGGGTLANLPDELQREDLPGQVRAFQPIFKARSVFATVDLGKSLDLNVHVRTKREAQAEDAEKALAAFIKLITEELGRELPDLEKEAAKNEGLKDLVKVFKAGLTAAKGAKFGVEGTEAKLSVSLPLEGLPLASAYVAAVRRVGQAQAVAQSSNNLKQIAIAMHNYHDVNNAFPPAAVCDKKGKPQLSWRVLILPYIEQEALYKQFKLDEPWDSENNKKFLAKMPAVYKLPGALPGTTATHYRVFVGNGAAFDWVMGGGITQITDGTSNTLMVVTAKEAVPWTKPEELEFDPEKDMSKLIGLVVNGKAQVAMCDGSVRTLSKLPSKETLNALITKNGGEVIGPDF